MAVNYLTGSTFMTIVLVILFVKISNDMKQEKTKRMYQILLVTVGLYVVLDAGFAVGFMSEKNRMAGFKLVVFLFFAVYVCTPFVWQLFVRSYVRTVHAKAFQILEKIPLVILLCMVVISVPTGYVWSITEAGEYVRGPGFQIFTGINLFYYLEAFGNGLYILYKKLYQKEPYLLQSLLLSTIPLAAILANTYLIPLQMTYPFQPFCLVLGTLFAYLFMADRKSSQQEAAYNASLQLALKKEKEASRQAIEAGKAKSVFLANMSHDIRTPINAILGFADIIDRHPEDEACVKNAVGKIKSSGAVLLNLINDVLDFTRIENNKLQLEKKPADLNQLISGLEKMFTVSMQNKHLEFDVRKHLTHPYVLCDMGKMQRVLVNIINNAVKFTPEGGQILLEAAEKNMDDQTGSYVFTVRDTGVGISQEFQQHMFEAFEQEHVTAVSNNTGAGLGLSIVKQLVDLMEGTIGIESNTGEGTTIQISVGFPVVEKEAVVGQQKPLSKEENLSGICILLAEDNDLNREIAAEILQEKGAEITCVVNGKEAVDSFAAALPGTYDIILMDIMMPVMDGLEATRKIRALDRPDAMKIPIIAMTANAFREDVQKSREAGIDEHLSKPLQYDVLIRTILKYSH